MRPRLLGELRTPEGARAMSGDTSHADRQLLRMRACGARVPQAGAQRHKPAAGASLEDPGFLRIDLTPLPWHLTCNMLKARPWRKDL